MTYIISLTSPVISTQSSASVDTSGFPKVQLVKLTEEWSLQSNSPSILMSLNPIQSSSVDAADSENNLQYFVRWPDKTFVTDFCDWPL